MKKLLLTLTLLLTLGFAASAADYSDELTAANFSGMSYTASKTYTGDASGATYLAQAYSNSGFQMRTSKAGTGIKNTTTLEGYTIESVEITFSRAGGGVNIYAADAAIDLKSLPSSATSTATATATVEVNAPYFAITPTNDTYCVVSKVVVNWVSTSATPACATPSFSVEDGVELFAGQTISVNKGNATTCELLVNGEPVEGLEYTIPEDAEIGSEITLTANSTLEGGDPAEATASIKVKVVEVPLVAEFVFSTFGWGNQQQVSTVNMGVVMLSFDQKSNQNPPKYFTNGNDVRLYGGGALTISVDKQYYITKIESVYNNTANALTPDCGSFNSDFTEWTNIANGEECKKNSVTFTEAGTSGNRSWKSITVSYAKRAYWVESSNIDIKHGKVAGVLTIDYTFEVANHNGNPLVVKATIDGMEVEFEEVEAPAAAPARAAAENAVISGTLKAKHDELKGATNLNINVAASLDGEELYNENHSVNTTTGIEDVTVEGNEAAEYFNLQGIRVAEPQAGQVYIVCRGAKTTKELVK